MNRTSRKIHNFFNTPSRIMRKEPSNFFTGAKIKHALDNITRVLFWIYCLRIDIPKKRLSESNLLDIFLRMRSP